MVEPVANLRLASPAGRWVIVAMVLGSGMAFLDATIVNVAVPVIGEDLDASLADLQWTINAYTLTLAGLILLGGALGDRYGRRRIFLIGVLWFALASLLCGIAPTAETLVVARALQGVGGALLTPGALAVIQSSFRAEDRPKAVGAWSGLAGIAGAVGPFLGGWLIEGPGWRWAFLLNIPVAVAVIAATVRHVPETRDEEAKGGFDVGGAVLAAIALAGVTYALIAAPEGAGFAVWFTAVGGIIAGAIFIAVERARRNPMLPLEIFRSVQFSSVNIVTFAVYAALNGVFFFLIVQLQVVSGYSPLAAGVALLPVTLLLMVLSAQVGGLAARIGPRLLMTVGPLLCAVATVLMARVGSDVRYLVGVLVPTVIFGLGLSLTVAPLTATVLASAQARRAGIASGVNNAMARIGGMLAVAALPLLVGLSGGDYQDPAKFNDGFATSMFICAGLLAIGGILSWFTISPHVLAAQPDASGEAVSTAKGSPSET